MITFYLTLTFCFASLQYLSTSSSQQFIPINLSIMSPITLPVFGSSSAHAAASDGGAQAGSDWNIDGPGDPMDFDFLAEYLLDDNPGTSSGIGFDFK
jgi:hypothetical protein